MITIIVTFSCGRVEKFNFDHPEYAPLAETIQDSMSEAYKELTHHLRESDSSLDEIVISWKRN